MSAELIDALATTPSYRVTEVGAGAKTWTVDNYRAVNTEHKTQEIIAEIANADVVTTAVGPSVLRFVAPVIAEGIAARASDAPPLAVMACENAINATDLLRAEVERVLPDAAARAIFANTAVDRIVPGQSAEQGLDVTVESFFEWVIERGPFGAALPDIAEATFVDDLAPYIERKLFTVNTGHAAAAYHGFAAGATTVAEALANPEVREEIVAVLAETRALLVAKYGLDEATLRAYANKIISRFENPELPDTVERVGREPLRKLGRNERFVGPAAELAERGIEPVALLRTVAAALRFSVPTDPQSVEMAVLLRELQPAEFVSRVTGLGASHPLYDDLLEVVRALRSPSH